MDLATLLGDLDLGPSPSERPRPSALPPITKLLSLLQNKLIGASDDVSEICSLIGRVERLFQSADPGWLFSPSNEEGGEAELQEAYSSAICTLIGCAALPHCEEGGALSSAAYHSIPARSTAVSSALTSLIGALGGWEGSWGRCLLLVLAPPTFVFMVTHLQDQVWTTPASRGAARCLQKVLLGVGLWRDSTHLLTGDEEGEERREKGILGGVLDVLEPRLHKNFLCCEEVKFVFYWILQQVTRPFLPPFLPRLLPPSLLLNDHYRPDNRMLGVQCLHHIVLNTPSADLLQLNRAEVLYQALFKHLNTTDAPVIQVVLPCMLDLLLVLEKAPSSPSFSSSFSHMTSCRHDCVLRLLLTHMEVEHKVELRRVYAVALPLYVHRMGVAVCRHLRRLQAVLLAYLEVGDPPEETSRLKILETFQQVIRAAWPRMKPHLDVLLKSLLRLLLDVSSDSRLSDSVRQKLIDETLLCMKLLDACSAGDVQCRLLQVDSSCCSSQVLTYLQTVTLPARR